MFCKRGHFSNLCSNAFDFLDDEEWCLRIVSPLLANDDQANHEVEECHDCQGPAKQLLSFARDSESMIRDQRHNQKANYRLFERFESSSSHRIEHQAQRDVRDDVVGEQNDDGSLLRVRWQRRQSDVESHTCCNWAEINRRCL